MSQTRTRSITISLTIDLRNPWTNDVSAMKMWVTRDDLLEALKCVLGNAVRVAPAGSQVEVRVTLDAAPTTRPRDPQAVLGIDSSDRDSADDVTREPHYVHVGNMLIEIQDMGPGLSQVFSNHPFYFQKVP